MKSQARSLLLVVAIAVVLGCAKKGPAVPDDLVPVQGVATIDGKPLDGAVVTFCPEGDGGPSAAGITDQQGHFKLTNFPTGNGARPGTYKVIVVKRAASGYSSQPVGESGPSPTPIPTVYGVPATTPLSATVPATGEIVLELKSKP